jgi:hypothetical protein
MSLRSCGYISWRAGDAFVGRQRRNCAVPTIGTVLAMVGTLPPSLFELRRDKCALPTHDPARCGLICLPRKRKFCARSATNWHDGQITQNLSSPSRKNIPLNTQGKSAA